ncbi:hypothetical protein [Alteraurantiacibacter buctensis]|uniref:Uncharacterized protein n=1 Tax=Alteraurantiacibacter buctensis TaxID=1503981 RepID=A0A844YXF1_9SPHN|nr:hypothetical protein [Alteraurantiacibacter buctensis]MXO71716.1 hypothetical protein [Alteraurantiacibacter buctensis]
MSAMDYQHFRDTLIVAIADAQSDERVRPVVLYTLCKSLGLAEHHSWINSLPADLESLGYGKNCSTLSDPKFLINGAGLSRAVEIRKARRPLTIRERISSLPLGKGAWDIFKIGLGVILGILATKYFGQA